MADYTDFLIYFSILWQTMLISVSIFIVLWQTILIHISIFAILCQSTENLCALMVLLYIILMSFFRENFLRLFCSGVQSSTEMGATGINKHFQGDQTKLCFTLIFRAL